MLFGSLACTDANNLTALHACCCLQASSCNCLTLAGLVVADHGMTPSRMLHGWAPIIADLVLTVQTQYGIALAVPLFIALAQNRHLSVIGVDRGVGSFEKKPAEDRIRIVSGRYDHANKLMVQARGLETLILHDFALSMLSKC